MFLPKIEQKKRYVSKFGRFTFRNMFRKRQGWRLAFYLKKMNFKAFVLYLLFNWHAPFDVLRTPVFIKEMESMRTYDYDIRAIMSENSAFANKVEDATFLKTVNDMFTKKYDAN